MSPSRTAESWLARRAASYSAKNRHRKAALITELIRSRGVRTVLLVGAESESYTWSNIVERALLESDAWVVASGLGPRIELDAPRVLCDGRRLAFEDKSFDLVVSNAVIEHVGDAAEQKAFVDEHHRVGRRFIITTPNLLFPVESHTRVIARHWSRSWRQRHRQDFTRLLTPSQFKALLPTAGTVSRGNSWSPTLSALHECDSVPCR